MLANGHLRHWHHWIHKTQDEDKRMDTSETLTSLDTQDTGRRQTNGHLRDIGIIGYTRHRTKTSEWTPQRHWHYWIHMTQDEDKRMDTSETLALLDTQDTGQRQANGHLRDIGIIGYTRHRTKTSEWTPQRHWHYWIHMTQDEDKRMDTSETLALLDTQDTGQRQANGHLRDIGIIGYTRHRTKTSEWTPQRHWHYWIHKTQDEDKRMDTSDTLASTKMSKILFYQCVA